MSNVVDQTTARLYNLANEAGKRLAKEPNRRDLRQQFYRLAHRARRAESLAFQADHAGELRAAGFVVRRP